MKRYQIKVIPRSSLNQVTVLGTNELKVKLIATPVEGKANEALIQVLADFFEVKKTAIRIVCGSTSRHKRVEVDFPS